MNKFRANILIILGVVVLLVGMGLIVTTGTTTEYEYVVKTEQVETDAGYSGSAVNIDNVSSSYQEAIFRAYKKSDHFLDGASVRVTLNERLNISNNVEWQVVDINGVRVLVGISGPETQQNFPDSEMVEVTSGMFLSAVGVALAFYGMVWRKEVL